MADGTGQKFPRWWQGLIILVSGIVIGLSSCVGFLNGLNFGGGNNSNQGLSAIFAIGFFAGLAMALVGFILMLIGIARTVVGSFRPQPARSLAAPPAGVLSPGGRSFEEAPEQRILRQFQMVLVVFMLLPAASIATSVIAMMVRPNSWH